MVFRTDVVSREMYGKIRLEERHARPLSFADMQDRGSGGYTSYPQGACFGFPVAESLRAREMTSCLIVLGGGLNFTSAPKARAVPRLVDQDKVLIGPKQRHRKSGHALDQRCWVWQLSRPSNDKDSAVRSGILGADWAIQHCALPQSSPG